MAQPPIATTPSSQRQRDRIQKVVDFIHAFNGRNIDGMRSYFADQHIDRTFFGHQAISCDAKLRMFIGFWDAFPDWVETLDEIVPGDNNQLIVRHTGRGTQTKTFMGREPDPNNQQLAADAIDIVTFDDNDRVTEYKTTFPFTAFFDEPITAAEHLMEARAEQGGSLMNSTTRHQLYNTWTQGGANVLNSLAVAKSATSIPRCQALLETNLRRCQNEAADGSVYCKLHQRLGLGPATIPSALPTP